MTIWRWERDGLFPRHLLINGRNYWRLSELRNWMDQQKRPTPPLTRPMATMSAKPQEAKPRAVRKRTYNTRLIKRDYPYFVSEVADLFHLHPNAVRRWIKAGLITVDDRRPVLVHGGDLIDFLDMRQAQRKQKCAVDELYCFRCRRPKHPLFNRIEVEMRVDDPSISRPSATPAAPA